MMYKLNVSLVPCCCTCFLSKPLWVVSGEWLRLNATKCHCSRCLFAKVLVRN